MSAWRTLLDRPRQLTARRWLFQIHLWAGLTSAAYVIVASVTGALLLLHEPLTPDSPRVELAGGESGIGPDAAVAALATALPGFRVGSLVPPEEPGDAYGGYLLNRGQFAYAEVHPVSGAVVTVITRQNSRWRFVEDLHNNLLSGRAGRIVNGVGGIALTALCLTGLVVWWPGRARWRRAVRVDWKAQRRRLLWDLHGTVGIWLLPLTLVIALSGAYHTWPQLVRSIVAGMLPVAPPDRPLRLADAVAQPGAAVADLLAAARAALPGKRVAALQLPEAKDQPIRATMVAPGQRRQSQADIVLLHPSTTRVIRIDRHADRPVGDRLLRWIGPVHAGRFAGPVGPIAWFIASVGMTLLAATGVALWWNRVVRVRLSSRVLAANIEAREGAVPHA